MSKSSFRHSLLIPMLLCTGIFFCCFGAGAIAAGADQGVVDRIIASLEQAGFYDLSTEEPLSLTVIIFLNNLQAALLIFLGGATLGVLTLFILATNGIVIGVVWQMMQNEGGIIGFLVGILPHGIFEIPALLIAGSLGLLLAEELYHELKGRGDAAALAKTLTRTFLLIVIPLLAVAAVIESFITPQLLNMVLFGA